MHQETEKWGWKQVSIVGRFNSKSGTKSWKCNHCNQHYNGSYSRVRAHLLGFNGLGVKTCPAIDTSFRETFKILDDNSRVAMKLIKRKSNFSKKITSKHSPTIMRKKKLGEQDVDETVARFFYGLGLNVKVIDSSFFREMVKSLGFIDPNYELPSVDKLCGSLLMDEKTRLEKVLALAKESWPYTGCSILCSSRLDGSIGCFCVNFFVASPKGVMFLKEVDIIEGDGPDNQFINELSNAIIEVGPSNVVQVITQLGGQASEAFESIILSKFPHIFWSHCTSHSIVLLMEEIAEQLVWINSVVSCAKDIEQCVSSFEGFSYSYTSIIAEKFSPSYFLVRRIVESKEILCQLVNVSEGGLNVKEVISKDEFWASSQLMIDVFEPFMSQLETFDVDKSVMGDVYNWRILSLETLRSKGKINDIVLNQLESLIDKTWDRFFFPLHGVAYILNPRYFGKDQNKDKSLMRAWNATIERYKVDIEQRRVLREELDNYLKMEGSFGERDAIECRENMEVVSWWENFGFETPQLQSLAIKVLSQIPSSAILDEKSRGCDNMSCKEAIQRFGMGAERAKDYMFVRNNLRFHCLKNRKVASWFGSGVGILVQGSSDREVIT